MRKLSILLTIIIFFLLILNPKPVFSSHRFEVDRDSYNYLVMSFYKLNNGADPTLLKNEMYGSIDFSVMSDIFRELYKNYVNLIDLTEKARIKINLNEGIEQSKSKQIGENDSLNTLLISLGALYSGLPPSVLAVSSKLTGASEKSAREEINRTNSIMNDIRERLRSEYSNFEFKLNLSKQNLINEFPDSNPDLFTAKYFEEYHSAMKVKDKESRYAKLEWLHNKNGRFYLAAFSLGRMNFEMGNLRAARIYLDESIENILTIVRKDNVRVKSLVTLSMVEWKDGNRGKAYDYINRAIQEIPDNSEALYAKSMMLEADGKYSEALKFLTTILESYPSSPEIQYQYAVLGSKIGQKQSIVLNNLEKAFSLGFNNIMEVHKEKAFVALRKNERYKKLTKQWVSIHIKWNLLAYDEIQVENGSKYDWTNVIIKAAYKNKREKGYCLLRDQQLKNKFKRINRGEYVSIPLGPCSMETLKYIKLKLTSDQGKRDILLGIGHGGLIKVLGS